MTPIALEESPPTQRVEHATDSGAEVTESSLSPFRWVAAVIRIVSSRGERSGQRSLGEKLVRWYKERKGMITEAASPPAHAVDDPLKILLNAEETKGLETLMLKSEAPNPTKAARHSAAAHFALCLKETGHLPA